MEFALMILACLCIALCARIIYGVKQYNLLAYGYNELREEYDQEKKRLAARIETAAEFKRHGYSQGYGVGFRKGLESAGDIAIIQAPRYGKAISKYLYEMAEKLS